MLLLAHLCLNYRDDICPLLVLACAARSVARVFIDLLQGLFDSVTTGHVYLFRSHPCATVQSYELGVPSNFLGSTSTTRVLVRGTPTSVGCAG